MFWLNAPFPPYLLVGPLHQKNNFLHKKVKKQQNLPSSKTSCPSDLMVGTIIDYIPIHSSNQAVRPIVQLITSHPSYFFP